jgi:predicted aspartyl protease
MLTTVYLKGPKLDISSRLLVDTGSTYTVISEKIMRRIGVSVEAVQNMQWIVTGSREERLPRALLEQFNCFGQSLYNFPVLVHTFPQRVERHIAGLLGMDFLKQFPIEIRTQ